MLINKKKKNSIKKILSSCLLFVLLTGCANPMDALIPEKQAKPEYFATEGEEIPEIASEEIPEFVPEETQKEELPDKEPLVEEVLPDSTDSEYITETSTVSASDINLHTYSDDELAQAASINIGKYAYERLGEADKRLYNQIYLTVVSHAENVRIETDDSDVVSRVFQYVMIDHPEIYWTDGYTFTRYTYGDKLDSVGFTGDYIYNESVVDSRQAAIDSYVNTCLAAAPAGDDYSKIKYVYEYIISHTEYDLNAMDNQNICSVFINGKSVCQGYAKAFQYILNKMGIFATLVSGVSNGGNHAWNLVASDGDFYYVDVTWGDASYKVEEGYTGEIPSINYDYLCVTTAEISTTHSPSSMLELPVCTSMKDNYYVREGIFFTTVDTEKLATVFNNARNAGQSFAIIKCSDSNVYASMKQHLLTDQHVFDYLGAGTTSVSFWESEGTNSISIRL